MPDLAGVLKLEHLSTDGTKMKANALNEAMREIIERGIVIDEEEDELYWDKRGDELQVEGKTMVINGVNWRDKIPNCDRLFVRQHRVCNYPFHIWRITRRSYKGRSL